MPRRRSDTIFLPNRKPGLTMRKRAAKHGDNCEICVPRQHGSKRVCAPAVTTVSGYRLCVTCWQTVYVMEHAGASRSHSDQHVLDAVEIHKKGGRPRKKSA